VSTLGPDPIKRATKKDPAKYLAGRELAALGDGPWRGAWYWRGDFEEQQRVARDQLRRCGFIGDKADYHPTDEWIWNPDPEVPSVTGRVWRYHEGQAA
jgi:hypothetical protein